MLDLGTCFVVYFPQRPSGVTSTEQETHEALRGERAFESIVSGSEPIQEGHDLNLLQIGTPQYECRRGPYSMVPDNNDTKGEQKWV